MDQSGRLHKTVAEGDRFIPNRAAMDFDRSHHEILKENNNTSSTVPRSPSSVLRTHASPDISAGPLSPCKTYASANVDASQGSKILAYKSKAPAPKEGYMNNLRVLYAQGKASQAVDKKPSRHIPQAPERVLDAPELVDDYYLNLLDWSAGTISPRAHPTPERLLTRSPAQATSLPSLSASASTSGMLLRAPSTSSWSALVLITSSPPSLGLPMATISLSAPTRLMCSCGTPLSTSS